MTKIYTLRALCLFSLFLMYYSSALADIVQGQDLTYRYLGNDSVELTASIYHDCHAIPVSIIQLGVIPSCGGTFYVNIYTPISKTDITPICKYGCTACSSGSCKASFGFEKDVFKTVVDLSKYKSCCDFTFYCNSFDQRGASATGGYGQYRYSEAHMNRCKTGYHSSPVFDYDPIMLACQNTCISRYQSATDFNGDSLVYSIVDPLAAAATPITYNTGYSTSHPVDVASSGSCFGYKMDAASGLLTFNPSKTNYYSTAIKVEMWHKDSAGTYVKTGDIMRDADLVIQDCSSDTLYPKSTLPTSTNSNLSGINGISGKVSTSVCAGNALSFTLAGISGNPIDSVRLLPRDSALLKYWTYSVSGIGGKIIRVNVSITPPAKMARNEPYIFDAVLRTLQCPHPDYINKRYYIYVRDSVPDLKIIKSDSGCGRYIITSSADTSSHLAYDWKINGASVSQSSSFNYRFLRNQKYMLQLTVSNSGGCAKTFTDSIMTSGLLQVVASKDTTICVDDSVDITATGAAKYQWKSANGKFSSAKQIVRVPPGIYYVTGSDTGGCSATDSVVVKAVGSELQWDKDLYVCEGDSVNLSVKNGKGYFFIWRCACSQNPIGDTTNWIHTRRLCNHFYFYALQRLTGCWVHGDVFVHFNHLTGGGDVSVCKGDSVQLHASGGTKYVWTAATGIKNLNIPNPYVYSTVNRSYALQITDSLGCTKRDTVHVKVSDMALLVSKAVSICTGSKVRLSASGGTHYSWSPIVGLDNYESAQPLASPAVTTMYHVTACDSLCGCVKKDSVLVTIFPAVNAYAGPDRRICLGDTIILGSPARKGYYYQWTSSDPNFRINTPQLKVSPGINTTYTLLVTDSATGCSDTDMVNIKVNPVTPLKMTIGNLTACRRFKTFFEVNSDPGYSYHWIVSGAKIYDGIDTTRISLEWIGPPVSLKVVRTGPNGCIDSLRIPVILFNDPHADFMAFKSCAGMPYSFLDSSLHNTAHRWDFGDGEADFSSGGAIAHIYKYPGWYRVKETASNVHGCFDTISKLIQVLRPANAHWQATSMENGKVYFSALDTAGLVYEWNFGDSTIFSGSKTVHTYSKGGIYDVRLKITDSFGCIGSADSFIVATAEPPKPVIISSDSIAISPNPFSEEIHIRYYLKENTSNVKVLVYDMVGQEVYASVTNDLPAGSYDQAISTAGHEFGLGMYAVKVIINDRTMIRKMLKVNY